MDVDAERVPVRPFLEYSGTIYYGLTVDPVRGDVYVAEHSTTSSRALSTATRPKVN